MPVNYLGDVACNTLGQHSSPFECTLCVLTTPLELPKEQEVFSKWRHTHREPPGGSLTPFLSRSNEGQSKRITESTGGSQCCGKKESSSPSEEKSSWHIQIKCSAFPVLVDINSKLSCQQGNDKVYLCSCTPLHNGASEKKGERKKTQSRKFTGEQEEPTALAHSHALSHTQTHLCINIHPGTRYSSDRPKKEWIFLHQTNSHCPLKERNCTIQTLKKVKSRNCRNTEYPLSVSPFCAQ